MDQEHKSHLSPRTRGTRDERQGDADYRNVPFAIWAYTTLDTEIIAAVLDKEFSQFVDEIPKTRYSLANTSDRLGLPSPLFLCLFFGLAIHSPTRPFRSSAKP